MTRARVDRLTRRQRAGVAAVAMIRCHCSEVAWIIEIATAAVFFVVDCGEQKIINGKEPRRSI